MSEPVKQRVRAGRLLRQGKEPAEVARLVGASRQTVYRWREVLLNKGMLNTCRDWAALVRRRRPHLTYSMSARDNQ